MKTLCPSFFGGVLGILRIVRPNCGLALPNDRRYRWGSPVPRDEKTTFRHPENQRPVVSARPVRAGNYLTWRHFTSEQRNSPARNWRMKTLSFIDQANYYVLKLSKPAAIGALSTAHNGHRQFRSQYASNLLNSVHFVGDIRREAAAMFDLSIPQNARRASAGSRARAVDRQPLRLAPFLLQNTKARV